MNVQPNMTEQNLPNGLPPQFATKSSTIPSPISFNGIDSSHSSRTSSPAGRLQQIPASQLPPSRSAIPASQLPPSGTQRGPNINQLAQNYAQLNVSAQTTPISSPMVQTFATSTPVSSPVAKNDANHRSVVTSIVNQNREFSPIPPTSQTGQNAFTHSTQSRFANVPMNPNYNSRSQIKPDPNQFQNVPLVSESSPSSNIIISDSTLIQNKQRGSSSTVAQTTSSMPTINSNHQRLNDELGAQLLSQVDKLSSNLSHQEGAKVMSEGQTKPPVIGVFSKQNPPPPTVNGQSKMQPSTSQPLFNASKFSNVPLSTTLGNVPPSNQSVQPPQPLQSYGSTPNLHQIQNSNVAYAMGNAPSVQNLSSNNMPQNPILPAPPNAQRNMPPAHLQQQKVMGVPLQPSQFNLPQKQLAKPQSYPYMPQQNMSAQRVPQQNAQQRPAEVGLQQIQPTFPPHAASQPLSNVPLQPPPPVAQAPRANLHSNRYPSAVQPLPNSNPPYHQNSGPTAQQNLYNNQNQYDYQNKQPFNSYNPNDPQQNYGGNQPAAQSSFSRMWAGSENYDLLQCPNILPTAKMDPPRISLGQDFLDAANCSPDIFRCTVTKIPETSSLLQKSRLPLGILIHPFKDLDHLPVIQCSTIVRCRACRTYINPFVFFVDTKRWKCNLCYRVNELPEEFQFDPVSKTYGDPSRRPEIKSSTIEYIAPSEYMLRPPQPAVYLFLLDVSRAAVESGYLHTFCNVMAANLSSLPGDARTQVGFIAYNTALHFYSLAEGLSQPHEMTVLDVDDVFLPCPDNLLVNLQERKELIADLLTQLPVRFNDSFDTGSALGAALQAAHKMISSTGGRVTVFQASLPSVGPGALGVREDPSQRAGTDVHHLNPANDFYKRLALECSGHQIAVDLFVVNSQYVDLATVSGISRFSGGCVHHFPLFKASRTLHAEGLERCLKRYLTRKIGFEAVMRIRCTRGLSIHTFHGNFFVRSTDLLSLPNVNPEAGFGMQVSIDESLSDLHTVCFQAALLYTSSKGERRIRVHTLCVPIASNLSDVINSADQQCIVGLLAKMAVDRSMQTSLSDAREAFINVAVDILSSYKLSLNMGSGSSGLLAPNCLRLLPLYISALLKHVAFRTGTATRLDDRVKAMCDMKSLPLYLLIQQIYPDLYPVHNLEDQNTTLNVDGEEVPQPPHLQLSARSLDSKGAFLLDTGEHMVLLVCPGVSQTFLNEALGVPDYNSITDQMYDLPVLDTPRNQRLNSFINNLNDEKAFVASLQVIRENSPNRNVFIERLIEDRIETALSYHEFLQHLKTQVK